MLGVAARGASPGVDRSDAVAVLSHVQPSRRARDDAEQQARWCYSTLTGEIAARTGHPEVAYAELLRAARDMHSEPLFERAVHVALAAQRPHQALAAVDAWRELQPESLRAQAWRVQLLLGLGRDTEAAAAIGRLLAMTPAPQRPQTILVLGGVFEGMHDVARALALARHSLAPYAALPQSQVVIANLQILSGEASAGVARAARALQADASLRPAAMLVLQHYTVDPPRADRLLAGYFKAHPDDDSLRMLWVDAAAGQQRASVALRACRALARRQPRLPQVWLTLGSLQQQLGRPRQAEQALLRFLRLVRPDDPSLQDLLHDTARPAGAASQAASAAAPPASSASSSARASGGAAAGNQGHALTQRISDADLARVYLALSDVALAQGDAPRAAEWLQRIPAGQRDGAAVALQRARVLVAQGRVRDGVALVQALPRGSGGERRQRLLALAELLQDIHEPRRAYAALASGMHAWGHQADYAYETAMAAAQAGRTSRMDEILQRIVREHADYQPALNALGYSLADQGRELRRARALIRRALRLSPGNPFVMDSLGWVEFRLGNPVLAQQLLEQAYDGRADPEIAAHLAQVLWRRGQRQRATELLHRAWLAAPRDAGVLGAMHRLGLSF